MAGGITQGQFSEDVSFEGGGALNFEPKGSMDTAKIDDFDTGKSVDFGSAGTITSVVSFDEASPIRGKASLLITCAATGSNSDNDWIKRDLPISSKYTGRLMNFRLQFQSELATGNIKVIAQDDIGRELINESLPNHIDADFDTALEFSRDILVHKGVSTITWGLHILNGEDSKIIKIDDIILTPDVRQTVETVFTEEEDTSIRLNGATAGSGAQYLKFTDVVEQFGSGISYDQGTGIFTILEDGVYHFTIVDEFLNVGELSIGDGALLAKTRGDGANHRGTCSWSGYLASGKEVNFYSTNTRGTGGQRVGYASKVGSVNNFPALKDQKVEIPTSRLRATGSSTNGTGSEDQTIQFDNLDSIAGDALAINNSNGTVVTILKDGIVTVDTTIQISPASQNLVYITQNNTDNSTGPVFSNVRSLNQLGNTLGAVERGTLSATFPVGASDTIRISCSTAPTSSSNYNRLQITHQEQEVSVAVNNIVPQYEEADSMIRLTGAAGNGSIRTRVKKFATLQNNLGSGIIYNQSPTSGDQFIIQERGTYHISFGAKMAGTILANMAIVKNIDDVEGALLPEAITDRSKILDISSVRGSADAFASVQWSGVLEEGDAVSGMNNTSQFYGVTDDGYFTISKQANPSVIGIDGRPIDAYQQEADLVVEAVNNGGGTLTAGVTDIDFISPVLDSHGTWDGTIFTVPEDGLYNIKPAVVFNTSPLGRLHLYIDGDFHRYLTASLESNVKSGSITISLEKGQEASIRHSGTGTLSQNPNHRLDISRTGSLIRSIPLIDSTVDIPTSRLRFQNTTGRGTGAEAQTIEYLELKNISGDALSYDSSNGTIVTIKKDGLLHVSASGHSSSSYSIYVSKNANNPAAFPTGNEIMANSGGTSSLINHICVVFEVKEGDIVRVGANQDLNATDSNIAEFLHQETEVAVALSNVEPQFEDVDSMIRVLYGNGHGSSGTSIRRFSSVNTISGSAIAYQDSSIDGASFTINENGIYHISYADYEAAGVENIGISLNSPSLVTQIGLIPLENRLNMVQANSNADGSCSWSGKLKIGDVIRAHTVGQATSPSAHFTISKQALPSIAEVDVTPFISTEIGDGEAGEIIQSVSDNAPSNFLYCNGSSYSTSEYLDLFGAIGYRFGGSGDTFNVPNLEGEFLRGLDPLTGRLLGDNELDAFQGHKHQGQDPWLGGGSAQGGYVPHASDWVGNEARMYDGAVGNPRDDGTNGTPRTADETRPKNVAVKFYIRYRRTIETVYAVEDNENVFSARIGNDGTATITSQSIDFIENVERVNDGWVTINFKPGFFTVIPTVTATAEKRDRNANVSQTHTFNQNTVTVVTDIADSGVDEDGNFNIIITRQGSDHKDLQRQIVQLKEFPKVNKTISESVTYTGYLSKNASNFLRFKTLIDNTSERLITATNEDHTRYTFNEEASFTASAALYGSSLNDKGLLWYDKSDTIKMISSMRNETTGRNSTAMTGRAQAGDYLTVSEVDGPSDNLWTNFSVTAMAEELKSVGNLAGGENLFSAKVDLTGGIASILSQNVNFIESITRISLGKTTLNFVPGFFTAPPAITANQADNTFLIAVYNISTTGATILTERSSDGVDLDTDYDVLVSRQGLDYRDAQEQIIQLDDFPRVNRVINEAISYTGLTTLGVGYMRYKTLTEDTSGTLVTSDNSGAITRFTFLKECLYTCSASLSNAQSSDYYIIMRIDDSTGANKVSPTGQFSYNKHITWTGKAEIGDYIEIQTNATILGDNGSSNFSVIAQANDLERITNIDAAENVLSASITNNWGVATRVPVQNVNWIQDITRNGIGDYTVTFAPGFFSVKPVLTGSVEDNLRYMNIEPSTLTENGCDIRIYQANAGTPDDGNLHLIAAKQGADYKSIQDVVVVLPESKTKWQTKYLSSDFTSNGVISDLTFNNLEIGKTYRLNLKLSQVTGGSQYYIDAKNGAAIICRADIPAASYQKRLNVINQIFMATATDVTFTAGSYDGGEIIYGDGGKYNTNATLEELPLHEQTAQW